METKPSEKKVIYWDYIEPSTKLGPESILILDTITNALNSVHPWIKHVPCAV